jgi:hypothetical protein
MGVSDQMMNKSAIDDNFKKPDKALTISKKNFFFIVFAVTILQLGDTAVLWLMGTNKDVSSHSYGDSFLFSAVIFGILKCAYDKLLVKGATTDRWEKGSTKPSEKEEDCQQSATCVVDMMKVKGPPTSTKTHNKTDNTRIQEVIRYIKEVVRTSEPEQPGCEATIWVSSWSRSPCLNPKAKKFIPLRTYWLSTLDSNSAPFMPQRCAKKEEQLLKSEFGGSDTGEVVYRSNHWLTEIGFESKKLEYGLSDKKMQMPETMHAHKRAQGVKNQKAFVKKLQTSNLQSKKWVPKSTMLQPNNLHFRK